MKKLFGVLIAVFLLAAFAVAPVLAMDNDTVDVTVTPSYTLTLAVNETSWDQGTLNYGSGQNTTGAAWAQIDTTGSTTPVDVGITAANATTWSVTNTYGSLGEDICMVNLTNTTSTNSDSSTDVTGIYWTSQQAWTNVSVDSTETFGLAFEMPPTGTTNTQQTIQLTFTATAHS